MSSILSQVSSSQPVAGIRAVIGGAEKIGKTTFCCSAPRPLLIPMERGYDAINVMKTPIIDSLDTLFSFIDSELVPAIVAGNFPYKSLVFDSATALEILIHNKVLQTDPTFANGNKKALTMEAALGGYGKAYQYANELFHGFLQRCDWLSACGINILITSHVFASKVVDPTAGEYDSWDLLLHSPKNQKTYGKREMLSQWADLIGFMHEPIFVSEGKTLNRAISANQGRVLALNRSPSYVAGNRYNLNKDIAIPREKGWNTLAHEIFNSTKLDFFNRD